MGLMFRPSKPSQAAQNKHTYIPVDIQAAMAEHVQQSMPAHLKQYQGGDSFIPQRAENEMTKHLEKTLPPHLKQYAGAYMQQNIVQPSLGKPGTSVSPSSMPTGPSPIPHAPVLTVQPNTPQNGPQDSYAANTVSPAQEERTAPDQPYAFITNPAQTPKQSPLARLPGGNSALMRGLVLLGGLLVLVIIFAIFKSLLGGGANLTPLVGIAQDQQELIHIATNASQQPSISAADQNLATTMRLSLASSQSETIAYLVGNHKKVTIKILDLKLSTTTDKQLSAAAAATTYDQTFQEVVQTKLTAYASALQQAYKLDNGKKGRALLTKSFQQTQLLQTQLTAAKTPS